MENNEEERIPTGCALGMTYIFHPAHLYGHCEEGHGPDAAIRTSFLASPFRGGGSADPEGFCAAIEHSLATSLSVCPQHVGAAIGRPSQRESHACAVKSPPAGYILIYKV